MTNPVFQEPSACPEKHDREAFEPDTGQRSRAIIPGDDPGDQQLPERGFDSTLATDSILQKYGITVSRQIHRSRSH
jgi:hypothetical protein